MLKILKYSFFDLIRSRWSYVYLLFYLLLAVVLLFLNNDLSKAIITLLNVIVILSPLIGIIFGIMYYYNSREFTELLLGQPIKRRDIFLGQYLGVSISLSMSLVLGIGVPFLVYGLINSPEVMNFLTLIVVGVFLTFIFTGVAFWISVRNENKIKGFGYAILFWMFMAVIYDGIFLLLLMMLREYPLEKFALTATFLNPIDLSRILILLKLDISALMGYTGAVFNKFLGTTTGMIIAFTSLVLWVVIPVGFYIRKSLKKDF